MQPVDNPGFYFEKGLHLRAGSSLSFINRVGVLEEFGSKVIHRFTSEYAWMFFMPETLNPLNFTICEDTNEKTILFYGSLYSGAKVETVLQSLLNIESDIALHSCLRSLSGVFSGMIYLKNDERILAFSDQFGVKKLFYSVREETMIVSSHVTLISQANKISDLSAFSFGSILYCGHIFCDSILEGISQVNAACYVEIKPGQVRESEYVRYPEPQAESFRDAIGRIKDAHLDFWYRMKPFVNDDITLLLSRGKDARVVLKYMLDIGINVRTMSFFRDDTTLYPFACLLQKWTEDYEAASEVMKTVDAPFEGIKIPNAYLLRNLDRIVTLNHGTPLHWEFLAVAEAAAEKSKFLVTGFVGDAIAGKSHHYYLMRKIRSASEYASIEFHNAGSGEMYSAITDALKAVGNGLPSLEEMSYRWGKQYHICNSDDINIIFQQGLFRTRGLGRVGPTFDQMRLYAYPIYPYNDNGIIDAYRSLPEKYLRWEKAHVAQLASDQRFSTIPTTRLNATIEQELRWLYPIGCVRKIDTWRKHIGLHKICPSFGKDEALRRTLIDLDFAPSFWDCCSKMARTQGFYQTVVNLISAVRICNSIKKQNATYNYSDRSLTIVPYERRD